MRWWCAAGTWSHADPPPGFDRYVLKTATLEPRIVWPIVIRALPDYGYLNRIGVCNPGLAAVLDDLPNVPGGLVVSILGFDQFEWADLAALADRAEVPTLELNLSCPNTEVAPNMRATQRAVRQARQSYHGELGAKLGPTVGVGVAKACEAEGADYLCLCNTLDTPLGALSGRPLRALALDCIARIAPHVAIPIVGGGGILRNEDAYAYLGAGATDVFRGTANLFAGHTPEAAGP